MGSGGNVGGGGSVRSWKTGCSELLGTSVLLVPAAPRTASLVALTALLLLSLQLLLWPLLLPPTRLFAPLPSVALGLLFAPSLAVPTMPMHAELLQGPVVLTALIPLLSAVEDKSSAATVLSEVATLVLASLLLLLLLLWLLLLPLGLVL